MRADVQKMVDDIVAKFGRLDVAMCNAGMEIQKAFVDIEDADLATK